MQCLKIESIDFELYILTISILDFILFYKIIMKKLLLSLCIWLVLSTWVSFADSSSDLFNKAYEAYEQKDYLNSFISYAEYIEKYPNWVDYAAAFWNMYLAMFEVWNLFLKNEEYDKSRWYFEYYIEKYPEDYPALFNLGLSYHGLGQYAKAIETYDKARDYATEITDVKQINETIINIKNYVYNKATWESEINRAILWMYENWLTMYKTPEGFKWYDFLTREQASKFFVVFTKKIMNKEVDDSIEVSFIDTKNADPTLQTYIRESSQLGLFQWVDGKFMPFNKLTRAQGITVFIRSLMWYIAEDWKTRYSDYYNKADTLSIMKGMWFNYYTLDSVNIKREEIALIMYRIALLLDLE